MPTEIAIAFASFAVLVLGALIYIVVRLHREAPPPDFDPLAQRLARLAGFHSLFDGLLARPMTRREKLGWLVVGLVGVLAIAFAGGRG